MDLKTNINVLIDTSYLTYFTTFSTFSWYQREFDPILNPDGSFDPSADPEFIAEFEYRFKKNIFNSILHIYPFFDHKKIIFAFDCARKNIWRMSYFPEYKISRKDIKRNFSLNGVFNFVNNVLVPNIAEEHGCKILKVSQSEGDDIIAILIKHFKDDENLIIASDRDLNQLLGKATIITLTGEVRDKILDEKEVKKILMKKILVGDGGDEIPSVFPRCGDKTAEKLVNNIDNLKKKLAEDKIFIEAFKRNTKLMDFDYIPNEIKESILNKAKEQNII